jgi:hypothetical protein
MNLLVPTVRTLSSLKGLRDSGVATNAVNKAFPTGARSIRSHDQLPVPNTWRFAEGRPHPQLRSRRDDELRRLPTIGLNSEAEQRLASALGCLFCLQALTCEYL